MSTMIRSWVFSGVLILAHCIVDADFAVADSHSRLSGGVPGSAGTESLEAGSRENRKSDVSDGDGASAQEGEDPCPPTTPKKERGISSNTTISPTNGQGLSEPAGGVAKSGKLKVPKVPQVGDKIKVLDNAYRMARKSLEEAEKSSQEELDKAIKNLKAAIGMLEAVGWQGKPASD